MGRLIQITHTYILFIWVLGFHIWITLSKCGYFGVHQDGFRLWSGHNKQHISGLVIKIGLDIRSNYQSNQHPDWDDVLCRIVLPTGEAYPLFYRRWRVISRPRVWWYTWRVTRTTYHVQLQSVSPSVIKGPQIHRDNFPLWIQYCRIETKTQWYAEWCRMKYDFWMK